MVNNVECHHAQCGSQIIRTINAPLPLVWSVVRRFDQPQVFKKLVQTCTMISGSGQVGSVRQVFLGSGLPGRTSVERLEKLDEEHHTIVYRVIDGDHKLVNFHVTTSLYEVAENENRNRDENVNENKKTLVIESYTVDVPNDSNEEDTCYVVNTIIDLNLKNLAIVMERVVSDSTFDRSGNYSRPCLF